MNISHQVGNVLISARTRRPITAFLDRVSRQTTQGLRLQDTFTTTILPNRATVIIVY